jgi:hypothetical protein
MMGSLTKAHIVMSTIAGLVLGGAGLAGAFAGLGFAAFWIAVLVGAPLSLFSMHLACRKLGIASPMDSVEK